MRTILLCSITIILFIVSCEDDSQDNVSLKDSIIPDNAENVRLRPTFGFTGGEMSWSASTTNPIITYNYYCDTINPPTELVLSTTTYKSKVIDKKNMLLPNRKYYWYCDALLFEGAFPTNIYSFTTIDTNFLQNKRCKIRQTYSELEYENAADLSMPFSGSNHNTYSIYGEPKEFTILGDSVQSIEYGEINEPFMEIFPDSGSFEFSLGSVKIANWEYSLMDFGVDYFSPWDGKPNRIILVLKSPYSKKVNVYKILK